MFTVLLIIGGLLTVFAAGGIYGEVTGTKKAMSELPMLDSPDIDDDFEDVEIEGEDLEYADSDEEERREEL